jgi:hypothetical protein
VNQQEEKLRQFNEESSVVFDRLVDRLAKDMDNTNEDIDIAEYDLRDFIVKNDAQLPEGLTFDLIMEKRVAPTVARRKKESKTLITNSIMYLEQNDFRMQEICTAVILFFKQCATKLDTNKEKLKKTEQDFQVSLAQCGDHHDDLASAQEEQLNAKVDQMKKAIHHVMLNTRLEECFEILDQIQRTYRNYNEEYCKLVQNYPQIMTAFFDSFEADLCIQFKMWPLARKSEVDAILLKETQDRQAKLEEAALEQLQAKLREEERVREEQAKLTGKPMAKAPPPAKKAPGKDDKPLVDVPKLPVPVATEFTSVMGNKYVREREMSFIAGTLHEPPKEEEDKPEAPSRLPTPGLVAQPVAVANAIPAQPAPTNAVKPKDEKSAEVKP